jgi:Xaa-Pro aminopeptidase
MYPRLYGAIERRLPTARLVDASGMLNELLMVKSEMEIELMKKCGECATAGVEAAAAFARPGMTEVELFAEIEYAVHAKGAEDPGLCLIASAPRGRSKYGWNDPIGIKERNPTMRRLEKGDIICLEITPFYKGYLLQKLRNIVLGPITPELRKTWEVYLEAHHRGMEAIRAGVTCRSVADAMNNVFLSAGYPKEMMGPPYFRVRGHGQGLGLSVAPGSLDGNDTILRERTVVVIHPSQFLPIEGGYMYRTIGDTFVARKDKAEHITAPLEPEIFEV